MHSDLIVIGGSEHARVVIEAALADRRGWHVVGFVDPNACGETVARLGVPRLGDDTALRDYPGASAILGFGSMPRSTSRRSALEHLAALVSEWAVVVHGDAWVSATASLGEGTAVMAGAVVQTGARIGAHVIVNSRAVVEHDVAIGDHAQVAPGAVIGGGTTIGPGAYIGLGASVRDHLTIGDGAIVGMGSTVVKDVLPHTVVMGGRAR
jgi:sugar O-acyltransferase (sialic acid O-acetyltransferase NeuD family)